MNGTFTKDSDGSVSGEEGDSPREELDFGGEDESDDDVESGNLPAESASFGSPPSAAEKKSVPKAKRTTIPLRKPPFLDMVVEAVKEIGDKKGASVPAIRTHVKGKYAIADATMKRNLKTAVLKAIDNEMLIRPPASKDSKGLTGRFKVNPEYLKSKLKEEKLKEKAKKKAEAENSKKKAGAKQVGGKKKTVKKSVNGKELKSLGEKSLAVKVAKEKLKKARKSIGMTPSSRPKAAPKMKQIKKSQKVASKSSRAEPKATKAKSKAAKTETKAAKGASKTTEKKPASKAATKKTAKAKK